ncbi:MAG: GGDEF domain-containing protein [Bacillota bacterium]
MVRLELNDFERVKRNFYLAVFPIIIAASTVSYFFFMQPSEQLDQVLLPVFVMSYSVAWILLVLKRAYIFVESLNLVLISSFHVFKFQEVVVERIVIAGEQSIGAAPFWTPLLFLFIFIILKGKWAFFYSIVIWTLNVLVFIVYWESFTASLQEQALHYNLSILTYVIFLFFARSIIRNATKHELLKELAYKDDLTKIPNRRLIYKWLQTAVESNQQAVSVVFLDIDHFKNVNDQYGHLIGDKVLIELTQLINSHLSAEDYLGRWGGEEFMILTYKGKQDAVALAENLRHLVERYRFTEVDQLTISLGVETIQAEDTVDTLVNRADDYLYKAKESGRNKVCCD